MYETKNSHMDQRNIISKQLVFSQYTVSFMVPRPPDAHSVKLFVYYCQHLVTKIKVTNVKVMANGKYQHVCKQEQNKRYGQNNVVFVDRNLMEM